MDESHHGGSLLHSTPINSTSGGVHLHSPTSHSSTHVLATASSSAGIGSVGDSLGGGSGLHNEEDVTQLFKACIVEDATARQQASYRLIQFLEDCSLSQLQTYAPLISRFTYASPFEDLSRRLERFINDYDMIRGDYDLDDDLDDDDDTKSEESDSLVGGSKMDVFGTGGTQHTIYNEYSSTQHNSTTKNSLRNIIQRPIAPSAFILHPRSLNTKNEEARQFLQQRFLDYGIVHHLPWVLSFHPAFCKQFYETFNYVMKENGPLPLHYRNYIAMIAAARHNCDQLIYHEQEEFLYNGGPPQWLEGVEYAPKKIEQIMQFNALLAHQPWLLTSDHIKQLLQGEDAWTIAELVHAIIIMTTFHALSGVIYGCGITHESDAQDLLSNQSTSFYQDSDEEIRESGRPEFTDQEHQIDPITHKNATLLETLQKLQRDEEERRDISQTEKSKLFEKAEDVGSDLGRERKYTDESPSTKYRGSFDLEYTDFNVRSRDYSAFVLHEYNWKEHGYTLLNRFVSGSGEQLEKEFNCIYHLTYQRVGREGNNGGNGTGSTANSTRSGATSERQSNVVDTTKFRQAIWFYSLRLFGTLNDDFNYHNVNILLSRSCKSFIKLICCYPEKITRTFFCNMDQGLGVRLSESEKVHICLLAVAGRKQAELLYA
eukprot:CAMPEP_0117443456 /NCGR_PEP_ID=MMETSP0759-20121206/4703_1 /TAXON_ID=63605 /ORGANISM="Percolomonas cosmopolitus, Strain WS" /LENGTH=656 /DNA_ID=CAMNT_0005235429 /DNA_START=211 /DNA_END=2178 /DNA_ORIENTATION=-